MKAKTTIFTLIPLALLLALVVLSALFFYPYAQAFPHRDSGIFLYMGRELLSGKTIYSEVWDHKPPFIFYINELGVLFSNDSGWGIWGIELVFLLVTVSFSFFTLRKKVHPIASSLICMAVFLGTFQFMGGNYTEEYALLFQSATIFVFLSQRIKKNEYINFFIIGVLTGLSFNFKQTYIDVTVTIGILLILEMLLEKRWINLKSIAYLGLGFLIPNIIIFLIMAFNGVVKDWWGGAYIYNFAYSDLTIFERVYTLIEIFRTNFKYPFFVLTFIAWCVSLLYLAFASFHHLLHFFISRKGKFSLLIGSGVFILILIASQFMAANKPGLGIIESIILALAIICLILFFLFSFLIKFPKSDLRKPIRLTCWGPFYNQKVIDIFDPLILGIIHYPIVLILAATSGRNYPHYFIPLYSSMFLIFSGIYLATNRLKRIRSKPYISTIVFLLLFLIGGFQPAKRVLRGVRGPYSYHPYRELVQYIIDNSKEDDQVLIWGIEPMINYLSNRSAPTRFSFLDSIYDKTPLQAEITSIVLQDIISNPPKFILDMRNSMYPFIDGKPNAVCLIEHPIDGTDLDKIIHFTCLNYLHIDRINGMEIYKRIDN